ncbi:MAG: hypothetical protein NTU62_03995 [Spirochaetes bacterium]|nr:hypothetical protein [Spirochaetota bacterium]
MSTSLVGSRAELKRSRFVPHGVYHAKGVNPIMTTDVFRSGIAHDVRLAEPDPEPETNSNIRNEWKIVATRQHERRRICRKAFW